MPPITIPTSLGWQPHPNALLEDGVFDRTTAQTSPRGGVASGTVTGPNFASAVSGHLALTVPSHGDTDGISFDFRVGSVGVDCPLWQLVGTGGTGQVVSVYFNAANDKIIICQNNGTGGKGSTLATGSFTVAVNTWVRCWIGFRIPAGGGTGNIEIEVRVEAAATDTNGPTVVDVTATTSNLSNTNYSAGLGGNHGGALLGQTLWVANVTCWENVTWGDEFYSVVIPATINGDGTDNDFAASTGNRWECVDEATPNGSGTTDSDYIWIDSTAANEQTFTVTYTKPSGYDRPIFIRHGVWHRNADGGKWTSKKGRYRFYSGTVIDDSAANVADPGSSYIGGTHVHSKMLNGDPAQIAGLEIGVAVPAHASEAARWQISAIGCEITFMRPREKRQGRAM